MATKGAGDGLSDEYVDIICSVCTKKNKHQQAKHYCYDCKKNFCVSCINIHNDLHDNHNVVEGNGEDKQEVLNEKCDRHPDKMIEFVCLDHGQLVCYVCGLTEHRTCEKLKQISESTTLTDVSTSLTSALENGDHAIEKLNQHIKELIQTKTDGLHAIEQYTKQLISKIEELQRKTKEYITTHYAALESEASQIQEECMKTKADIKKVEEDMQIPDTKKANLLMLVKKGHAICKQTDTMCKETEGAIKKGKSMIRPNRRIEDFIDEFPSLVEVRKKGMYTCTFSKKERIYSDRIIGCCALPGGNVLLADYGKSQLIAVKPYSRNGFQLQKRPVHISCIDSTEVAVCTGSDQVLIVNILSMECTGVVTFGYKTSCLAFDNEEVFASDGYSVFVHDMFGALKRTIYRTENKESLDRRAIFHLSVSPCGERVYIAHSEGITSIDRKGTEYFTFSQQLGLLGPYDLATDHQGNVLVYGHGTNNIVQLTKEGKIVRQILSKADTSAATSGKPASMCYDVATNKLYVVSTSDLCVFSLQ